MKGILKCYENLKRQKIFTYEEDNLFTESKINISINVKALIEMKEPLVSKLMIPHASPLYHTAI
jgi:hypothetical protein